MSTTKIGFIQKILLFKNTHSYIKKKQLELIQAVFPSQEIQNPDQEELWLKTMTLAI